MHPNSSRQQSQTAAVCCPPVARLVLCMCELSVCKCVLCVCVCVGWGSTLTLSNSACGEGATPVALPVQAAETGRCWRAPCWEPPEASC